MKYRYSLFNIMEETVHRLAGFFYIERNKLPHALLLNGEVGTGKTTFARSYINAGQLGISFASPTYTIVRNYKIKSNVIMHFDLYRVNEQDYEWIDEVLEDQSAFYLFEWANLHHRLFDDVSTVEIEFVYDTLNTRTVNCCIDEVYSNVLEGFLNDESLIFEKRYESTYREIR